MEVCVCVRVCSDGESAGRATMEAAVLPTFRFISATPRRRTPASFFALQQSPNLSSSSSFSLPLPSLSFPSPQTTHHCLLPITASTKKPKPPPKPASRNAIIASILAPLLLAAGAAFTGKLLLRKLEAEALDEAKEWEKRFDPQRLLPDGRKVDDEITEKTKPDEDAAMVGTRNRPKRVE